VNAITTDPEDRKLAVDRIEEIAQMQLNQESPVSSNSDSQAIPQPQKTVYPPPVNSKYRQEPFQKSYQQTPEATSPPPVEPRYNEEKVYQLSEPPPIQSDSSQLTNRVIPWTFLSVDTLYQFDLKRHRIWGEY
jgi:hypothetical protein